MSESRLGGVQTVALAHPRCLLFTLGGGGGAAAAAAATHTAQPAAQCSVRRVGGIRGTGEYVSCAAHVNVMIMNSRSVDGNKCPKDRQILRPLLRHKLVALLIRRKRGN